MTDQSTAVPREIRATVHEDAIQRVSRFFDASFKDTLAELFQNARRAGASKVNVTIEHCRVTVEDDGHGIADPQTVLAFGLSDWQEEAVRREDPAGMGIYALARQEGVVIRSRHCEFAEGWEVRLSAAHFAGERAAPVTALVDDRMAHGTSVSFVDPLARESGVEEAARFFPLPVELNGKGVEQVDFLHDADHIEEWRGLRIGVKKRAGDHETRRNVNFHGITVREHTIPAIDCLDHPWRVSVDVRDCPELLLTLPARKELVKTPFLRELARTCRAVVYRAMLADPELVDLPWDRYMDAHALGIDMPEARPLLRRWEPDSPDYTRSFYRERPGREDVGNQDWLMGVNLEIPDQQALLRALKKAGIAGKVWKTDPRLAGYGWYGQLERIVDVAIMVEEEDGTVTNLTGLEKDRYEEESPFRDLVRSITFALTVAGPGQEERSVELTSDLAFFETRCDWYEDLAPPIVAREHTLHVGELTEVLMEAFFSPSDSGAADSYETQKDDHKRHFLGVARSLLVSKLDSVRDAVQEAIQRHVLWELPADWGAEIRIRPGRGVETVITPPA